MRIVVLVLGSVDYEVTTRLSEEFGDDVDVALIDKNDGFVFGFSKLDVMFGKALATNSESPRRQSSRNPAAA